jgi:hypothetical protein
MPLSTIFHLYRAGIIMKVNFEYQKYNKEIVLYENLYIILCNKSDNPSFR